MTVSGPPGPEDPALRASDAERDAVADLLREAHAEGRLTVEEFTERLDAAFAARTHGDLVALTRDLPSLRTPERRRRTGDEAQPARRRESPSGITAAWGAWAVVVSVNLVIWAAVSLATWDLVYFWPMWVAFPWGIVLVIATASRNGRGR
jgi:hypothetical protein